MLLQQPARGHDHSSLTISALRDLLLKPRALTWMTHVRRQPFNGDKTSKRRRRRGNLAGAHCFSIFEHGARAANAHSAAKFRARQSEIVTDEPKQWSIVVSFDNMSGPINREIDLAHDDGSDSDFALRHWRIPACSKLPLTLTGKSGQTESAGSDAGQIDMMLLGIVWRDRRARRNGSRRVADPPLEMKDICDILREWKKRPDANFALATLVRAEGSSYRRPGARMLICEDGNMVGSLSAGCLEEEVALRAREVLRTGEPSLVSFDTRKRFGCAGKIDIFIECAPEELLGGIAEPLEARRECRLITRFRGAKLGSKVDCDHEHEHEKTLVQQIHPPIRLFIFGDGLDGKPFHSLGNLLGWQTFEIATANELPSAVDEWTAAIVKSHNYGRDFAALQKLLPLGLRYIGLIGPRKRRNQLLSDLLDVGVTINAGFFAPAGLDLGAETPEEIAVAIVSEIQRAFAGASGESLRDRKVSIHAPIKGPLLA